MIVGGGQMRRVGAVGKVMWRDGWRSSVDGMTLG